MKRPDVRRWAIGVTAVAASVSAHAALISAVLGAGFDGTQRPPVVEIPVGSAAGRQVVLVAWPVQPAPRVEPEPPPPPVETASAPLDPVAAPLDPASTPTPVPPPAPAPAPGPRMPDLVAMPEPAIQAIPGGDPGVVSAPAPLASNRPPDYPAEARRRRQQGTVLLHLAIGADGAVSAAAIARSSGVALLDEAAREAASSWRFTPALEGGVAVAAEADVPIEYLLKGDQPPVVADQAKKKSRTPWRPFLPHP